MPSWEGHLQGTFSFHAHQHAFLHHMLGCALTK